MSRHSKCVATGWRDKASRVHGVRDRTHDMRYRDSIITELTNSKKKKNDPWDLGRHSLVSKPRYTNT